MKQRKTLGPDHAYAISTLMSGEALRVDLLRIWFEKHDDAMDKAMLEVRDYLHTNGLLAIAREIDNAWWKIQETEAKAAGLLK